MNFFSKKEEQTKKDTIEKMPPDKIHPVDSLRVEPSCDARTENSIMKDMEVARILALEENKSLKKYLNLSLIINLICVFLLIMLGYFSWNNQHLRYFAATRDFRVLELEPLNKPYISESGLLNFVANTVTETFTLDFNTFRNSLAKIRLRYSQKAFKQLEEELRPTVQQILDNRLIMSAVCEQTPRLLNHGVQYGRYSWQIQVPLTVSLQGAQDIQTMRWMVTVVVSRTNIIEKPQGIEVVQIITEAI